MAMVIAVDGPSGAGKSSTSRGVAKKLGLAYLDTGSMYRAIQVAGMQSGVGEEKVALAQLVDQVELVVETNPDDPRVYIDGIDVSEQIRSPRVSALVSNAATAQHVRDVLTDQMRQIIVDSQAKIVVEGRDITTKVWPDAELRILLTASEQARIDRRERELQGAASREDVTDQVVRRDRDDSTMSEFMHAADGVVTIDSTYLSLTEVIDMVCDLARKIGFTG